MAGDRPRQPMHMNFSALDVDFSGLGPNLLRSTRPAHAGVKDGYPFKKWRFLRYSLLLRENACR